MPKTRDNLLKVFSSAAESNIRYLVFAEKAGSEGHPYAAKVFRAVAMAKMFHALSFFRAAGMADMTAENLEQAMEEETYDFKKEYPPMIQDAVKDEMLEARHSLEYGMSIGPIITKYIGQASGDIDADKEGSFYVCPVCGNIEFGSPPAKCPFCGVDASKFVEVS
jgi:rubrerythrin